MGSEPEDWAGPAAVSPNTENGQSHYFSDRDLGVSPRFKVAVSKHTSAERTKRRYSMAKDTDAK